MPNEIKRTNKGFMSYTSMLNKYRQLTKDEFYDLYWAVAEYVETGKVTTFEDRYMNSLYQDWLTSVDNDFKKYNDTAEKNREKVERFRAKQKDATGDTKNVGMNTSTTQEVKVPESEEKEHSEPINNNVPAHAYNKTVPTPVNKKIENTFQAPIGNKKPDVEFHDSAKLKDEEYERLKSEVTYALKKYPDREEEMTLRITNTFQNERSSKWIDKEVVKKCFDEMKKEVYHDDGLPF